MEEHVFVLSVGSLWGTSPAIAETPAVDVDVCIYRTTPSEIVAAVAVRRDGHVVTIFEPSRWVGGMLGAGLKPMQDCPNIHATGGMTRSLLSSLGQPAREQDGQPVRERRSNRELSPKDIREDFFDLLQEHDVRVIYEHRVSACEKVKAAIRTATPIDES